MNWFNHNGKMLRDNTPVIGVNNRGLRYGDGLFETMKSIKGRLILTDEHFARLWKGMKMLRFSLTSHFTPDNLQLEVEELLKKNGHDAMARIRITVFRGDGGLYDATDHKPHYIIQSLALPAGTGEWNSNGLVLGIYHDAKKSCDAFSNLKHNNFLPYAMAALFAKEQKWNDAVVLNNYGRTCDTSMANIFLVKDELVLTPSLDEG
ncbi:MAG TPA: aminotransferase class IV, partial [Ferruginibacter sp.]|nr:aminotransferase class IV [Ferruginibacter sp.]